MPGESFPTMARTAIAVPADVRLLTGFQASEVSDPDLVGFILRAQILATEDLGHRVQDLQLEGRIDGSNTRFQLPGTVLGTRVLMDQDLSGSEATDALVYLRSPAGASGLPTYTAAAIASADALHGQVVLAAAPAAASVDAVLLTAWLMARAVSRDRLKTCVELLAAHLADQKVRGPGAVVPSNPAVATKDAPAEATTPRRSWLGLYREQIQKLKGVTGRAATVRTALPRAPSQLQV